jgi:hypothetical protein
MSFFEEADSEGIVEDHIKKALNLEDSQQTKLLKSYRDIQSDLLNRIKGTRRGTFTRQHLIGVLAQVQGAIGAMTKQLAGDMNDGAYDAALMGVDHLIKEINTFDERFTGAVTPINLNAAILADDVSNLLANQYQKSLDKWGGDMLNSIAQGLMTSAIGETTNDEVVERIMGFFTGKEWEVRRIVRTELHHVYNKGKLESVRELSDELPDLKKALLHPMDQRTGADSIALAKQNPIIPIEENFVQVWQGRTLTFMVPPNRPNDRAVMIAVRPEWGFDDMGSLLPGRYPKG